MRNRIRRHHRNRGFTLIELLLVMVILAILAAVVVPKMVGRRAQAEDSAAHQDISAIGTALDAFEVDNGRYPSSEEGLQALMTPPGNAPNWHGPYLKLAPVDPWKQQYVYVFPGQHNPSGYDLFTTHGGTDTSGNQINSWSNGTAQ